MKDYEYYKARATDVNVKLEDITDEYNAYLLARLRDNDPLLKYISITTEEDEKNGFEVRGGDDLGWLGYFIGKSEKLKTLNIDDSLNNINLNAFSEGLGHNQSIQSLNIGIDFGESFQSLVPFLRNNDSLSELTFHHFDIGLQCARNIALLLGQQSSLKRLEIYDAGLDDEGLVEILTAVRHTQIEELSLPGNHNSLGRDGYAALGRMLKDSRLSHLNVGFSSIEDERICTLVAGLKNCYNLTSLNLNGNESITEAGLSSLSIFFQSDNCRLEQIFLAQMNIDDEGVSILAPGLANLPTLRKLNLSCNSIGDQGIQAMVRGLINCQSLEELRLSNNHFTANGLAALSLLLRAEHCNLSSLYLYFINICDDGAAALTNGLRGNKSLTTLYFNVASVKASVLTAFSRLLFDTSSVNNTYLSNHTLEKIRDFVPEMQDTPQDIVQYLKWNESLKQAAAICKILHSHPDIDITPLFEFNLKCLPFVVAWLEKAKSYLDNVNESTESFQSRQLSAVYKFVRGMPQLVVDGYRRQKTRDMLQSEAATKKRKFDLAL